MTPLKFRSDVVVHHRHMFAVALSILHNEETAADAVQDALMTLWESRSRLKTIENLRSYCLTVTRSKCIDIMRMNERFVADSLSDSHPTVPDPSADTLRSFDGKEKAGIVSDLIAQLNENQRRVIILSAYHSLSNSEIASVTGLTEQNVRVLLCRARQSLRRSFAPYVD